MKHVLVITSVFFLSGCLASVQEFVAPSQPDTWSAYKSGMVQETDVKDLRDWWTKFRDPALDALVTLTLEDSPERLIAEARIQEARGIRRTASSSLFPQIGFSADGGRQDTGSAGPDDFFEAGFDASYEIDVFGQIRNTVDAADANIKALEAEYHDVSLTLIAEVARSYINYRAAQKQADIAKKNLDIQEQTLELVRQQKEFGEAPQLDVERSENLVNTTRASIPEFERLADNARLQLTVLTGHLPEELLLILQDKADIPGVTIKPVLMAPADVLALRPDIRAANATLAASSSLADAAFAELFPSFTLSGFFGYADGVSFGTESIWNIVLGTAVALLDFGRIEGAIDAARAIEVQAFQAYRLTILEAITEVETALNDTARINEQRISLRKAYNNADQALQLSQTLYREGEISFIDVLDAQRTLNEADAALVSAEAAQAESAVRLYKSLGVY